jgi:hypothetical protein
MKKNILILLFLGICFIGCEENEENELIIDDQNYPTTLNIISQDKLEQLKLEYFQKNPFISSSLNRFGFCAHSENIIDFENLPHSEIITQEMAINIVNEFVANNIQETGIISNSDIQFKTIKKIDSDLNPDISSHWYLDIKNQMLDSIEVLYTGIGFRIINGTIVICANNWYPHIYIPRKFNFNSKEAKSSLVNKVVLHNSIGGPFEITITQENIDESTAKLKVKHITKDDKIELRVVWEVTFTALFISPVYVDVMTGEIISE